MGGLDLASLPLAANLGLFAAGGVAVWLAGSRLALYADALAERTGLGQVFLGLVLLASVTELPELVTSLAAVVRGDAALAVNNMFGGIVMQTAILALADALLVRGALTWFTPRPEVLLQGILLVVLLALVLAGVVVGELLVVAGVGAWTAMAAAVYLLSIWLLRRFEAGEHWRPVDLPEFPPKRESGPAARRVARWSVRRLVAAIAGVSLVVLAAGILLVGAAEALAAQTGLGSSFVGATLLAATTSLPEVSTTLAAVRLRAYGMAFANIFGSNAIMVALLFLADVAYRPGPILAAADRSAGFAAVAGIAATGVYLTGLVMRRNREVLRMGLDSLVVVAMYAATLGVLFVLRGG